MDTAVALVQAYLKVNRSALCVPALLEKWGGRAHHAPDVRRRER